MTKVVTQTNNLNAVGPYSLAREHNGILYCSGQIGIDQHSQLVKGGTLAEFEQIISNVKEVLDQAEYEFKNTIKVVIYLKDVKDFKAINQMYQQHFRHPYPVRTTVVVSNLPLNANIEVEVMVKKNLHNH